MPATRNDINHWLDRLYEDPNLTHMIVRCDSFEFSGHVGDKCCYPVYVEQGEDVHKRAHEGGDRLMEVYSRNHTREEQMNEHRAHHYD